MSPPRSRSRRATGSDRIACLLVPDLALRAALRAEPALANDALVVASGGDGRAQILAVSPLAARLGLEAGRSLAHARAVAGELCVRVTSPALERAARDALLDVALSLSPRAVLEAQTSGSFANEAAVLLDASGVETLFESEARFASVLAVRSEAVGLPAVVAVASSRSTAHLAARAHAAQRKPDDETHCVLVASAERRFLAPLSLDLLDPPDALAQSLTHLGVRTVRDLLRLPRTSLSHRLGPAALVLARRAGGEGIEEPLPEASNAGFEEAIELDYGVHSMEPLLFAVRGMLSRLCERLKLRGMACDALDFELTLAGGGRDVRRVAGAAPTSDERVWLRLIALAFETNPPKAPIEELAVRAQGLPRRSDQLDLFRPAGPDPVDLDRTLAELEALCGAGRVGAPAVADDHRLGRFEVRPFALERARRAAARSAASPNHSLAVRALRPPVAAQVRLQAGHPSHLRSAIANGDVVQSAGPWRTTGRWWSEEERFALDHYDVQTSDGSVLRLCFDWTKRRWLIDAIYD